MTVSSTTARVDYAGNGVTTLFSVPFPFIQNDYLQVLRINASTLVSTTLVLDSVGANGYTVSGAGNPTGSVTVVTAPTASERLAIVRVVPATQEADFVANDPFPAETFEDALDKLTMVVGQAVSDVGRALKLFEGDLDGSGRYDANANRIVDLADGVSASDAATVGQLIGAGSGNFIAAGVGSVTRTMQNKVREIVSVLDYGAAGDGVTDDSVAVQAAMDAVAVNGGTVMFPAGVYLVGSALSLSNTGDTQSTTPRVSFVGDGSRASRILFASGNYVGLTLTGSNTPGAADAQVVISGLYFDKPDNLGTCLSINRYSHITLRDMKCNGSDLAIALTDVQESHLESVIVTFANGGIKAQPGTFTSPNAIMLLNCKIGNCNNYGLDIVNAACVDIIGGSIEGNNNSLIGGTATTWGVRILWNDATKIEGSVGVNIIGCYIENNGLDVDSPTPTGDVWIVNSVAPMAVTVKGCSFQRHDESFCTNTIRMETSGGFKHTLSLDGNGHGGFYGYVPDAGRPYVFLSTPAEVYVNEGKNVYRDAVEIPDFTGQNNMCQPAMAAAWVRFDGSGANGAKTIQQGYNVASVNKTSTGIFVITYGRALKNSTNVYVPGLLSAYGFAAVTAESTSSITLQTADGTGTVADFQTCITVFGDPA